MNLIHASPLTVQNQDAQVKTADEEKLVPPWTSPNGEHVLENTRMLFEALDDQTKAADHPQQTSLTTPTLTAVTAPTTPVPAARSSRQRQHFFAKPKNLTRHRYQPDQMYDFEFTSAGPYLDFANFKLKIAGFSIDLLRFWDGQVTCWLTKVVEPFLRFFFSFFFVNDPFLCTALWFSLVPYHWKPQIRPSHSSPFWWNQCLSRMREAQININFTLILASISASRRRYLECYIDFNPPSFSMSYWKKEYSFRSDNVLWVPVSAMSGTLWVHIRRAMVLRQVVHSRSNYKRLRGIREAMRGLCARKQERCGFLPAHRCSCVTQGLRQKINQDQRRSSPLRNLQYFFLSLSLFIHTFSFSSFILLHRRDQEIFCHSYPNRDQEVFS